MAIDVLGIIAAPKAQAALAGGAGGMVRFLVVPGEFGARRAVSLISVGLAIGYFLAPSVLPLIGSAIGPIDPRTTTAPHVAGFIGGVAGPALILLIVDIVDARRRQLLEHVGDSK